MKRWLILFLLAGLASPWPAHAQGPRASVGVTVNAYVEAFAEWDSTDPLRFQVHDSADAGPYCLSGRLTLYSNTSVRITAVAGENAGVLSRGAERLPTFYRLTGPVTRADEGFLPALQFFSPANSYQLVLSGSQGAYPITVELQTLLPARTTPSSEPYTCSVILIATWGDGASEGSKIAVR